jgi:hypothetical protein
MKRYCFTVVTTKTDFSILFSHPYDFDPGTDQGERCAIATGPDTEPEL